MEHCIHVCKCNECGSIWTRSLYIKNDDEIKEDPKKYSILTYDFGPSRIVRWKYVDFHEYERTDDDRLTRYTRVFCNGKERKIHDDDVKIIQNNIDGATREIALRSLAESENDLVNAIMWLSVF
jgi:hypothetical protein